MFQRHQPFILASGLPFGPGHLVWRDPDGDEHRVVLAEPGRGEVALCTLPADAALELTVDRRAAPLRGLELPTLRATAAAGDLDAGLQAFTEELAAMAPGPARDGWFLALCWSVRSLDLPPSPRWAALVELVLAEGQERWLDGCAPLLAHELDPGRWAALTADRRAALCGVLEREPLHFCAALSDAQWVVFLTELGLHVQGTALAGLRALLEDPEWVEYAPSPAVGHAVLALAAGPDANRAEDAAVLIEDLFTLGVLSFEDLLTATEAAVDDDPDRARNLLVGLNWCTPAADPARELFWDPESPAEQLALDAATLERLVALLHSSLAGTDRYTPAEIAVGLAPQLDAAARTGLADALIATGDEAAVYEARRLLARSPGLRSAGRP